MGEGWSDVLAFWTQQTDATPQDWTIGSYIQPGGVRSFPYSINKTVNPLTYSSAQNADGKRTLPRVYNIPLTFVWFLSSRYVFSTLEGAKTLKLG